MNLDDQLVLKGYRWLLEGVHPELELSRFLTETAKFTHIPQLAGTVEYLDAEGQSLDSRRFWSAMPRTRAAPGLMRWTIWSASWTNVRTAKAPYRRAPCRLHWN